MVNGVFATNIQQFEDYTREIRELYLMECEKRHPTEDCIQVTA